jgi:hypothetical protein
VNALVVAALLASQALRPGPDMRDVALRPPMGGPVGTLDTLDAAPYERTVTCGSLTLTGTYINGSFPGITWSASPSGASGSCTNGGVGVFSCVVSVAPDAVGEGVETITVTDGDVANDQTVDLGFYVDGANSCWLAQNINGAYNVGLSDLDAVATWVNLGSGALDLTQATGAAQPTYRTSIVGGQPVVRCDGGDHVAGAVADNWTFTSNGTDITTELVFYVADANPDNNQTIAGTGTTLASTNKQASHFYDDRSAFSKNNAMSWIVINSTSNINFSISPNDSAVPQVFHLAQMVLDDDGGAGVDATQVIDGTTTTTATRAGTYGLGAPAGPFSICAYSGGNFPFNGDVFRVLIYRFPLDATQRGINKAVDEWALGGALPVTP